MPGKIAAVILLFAALSNPAEGHQHRSHAAVAYFKATNPCPANGARRGPCPGYIVDHVKPLACGGPDRPTNMQWQTKVDAKAKDRWELRGCR